MAGKTNPYICRKAVGKGTVDTTKGPDWWVSRADEAEELLRSLKGVEVSELGKSSSGHSILCATYGMPREDAPGRTTDSLINAISGRDPNSFYGNPGEPQWGHRRHDCFMFLGNMHGLEYEGTVAMLNALNVIVSGKDLRGKRWPKLQEAGRKLRLIVVPHFNMDGRVRWSQNKHKLNVSSEDYRRLFFGNYRNGEKLTWPNCFRIRPIPVDEMQEPLGCYFNDKGITLDTDTVFLPNSQPETHALMRFLWSERPDCVLLSHTDHGSLVQPPSSFIPQRFRMRQAQLSALVATALKARGLSKYGISQTPSCYAGEAFYQCDMTYHICGCLPIVFEFPYGSSKLDTLDEILDIGLTSLQEILSFGARFGFRPWE